MHRSNSFINSTPRKRTVPRSCRRLRRNITGWFEFIQDTYSDRRFKKTFRVSKATFQYILSHIGYDLEKETVTEIPISAEFRLAICLYRLGRGNYHYTIAEMAGIGLSTFLLTTLTSQRKCSIWKNCGCHIPIKCPAGGL